MHELALTQSILDIALAEAAKHRAARVLEICIKAGALAGVLPELIQEYFNIVSAGTAAEGALLTVEKLPAVITCLDCGAENETQGFIFTCPVCNSNNIKLLKGREFYVYSLEAE
ncbi:MAG: hydrogenase maturation nickel metallochaperone HypA [Clostridiales bacterium]|nr:hydrogenase maturation nickel metallochaperone HypA [Clostridiales bacterium]